MNPSLVVASTHPSILAREVSITEHARTLANCVIVVPGDDLPVPSMLCNRAIVSLHIPEFFEAEELGVAPVRACKKLIKYDADSHKVTVSHPWTEDVCKLVDNLGQAIQFQSSVEPRLLKDQTLLDAYNMELHKFVDRGALVKLTQRVPFRT